MDGHFVPLPLHPVPKQSPSPVALDHAHQASMRRKKNADAQAAFRARRANYIASLEETVISLESVVLSLQDSCRDARADADDLRHENARLAGLVDALRQSQRDRERDWREYWATKQQALGFTLNDLPLPRPTPDFPSHRHNQYVGDSAGLRYPHPSPPADSYPATAADAKEAEDARFPPPLLPPFGPTAATASESSSWLSGGPFSHTRTPCINGGGGGGGDTQHHFPSHSSEASDSPPSLSPVGPGPGPGGPYSSNNGSNHTQTTPASTVPSTTAASRFLSGDENRMSLVNLSMPPPYAPRGTPPFLAEQQQQPLRLPELPNLSQPQHDYDSAAVAAPHLSDGERFARGALPLRRTYSAGRPGDVYAPEIARDGSPLQLGDAASEAGLGGGEHAGGGGPHLRPRRHTSAGMLPPPPMPGVHSPPSPSSPPGTRREGGCGGERDGAGGISNTLAVIKAQAFGSLRRTRPRAKKASDAASKVAIDMLAARGAGMGVQVATSHRHKGENMDLCT